MRTPSETIAVKPGAFVVHPPGEVHEYANGAATHAVVPRPLRHRHGRAPFDWRGRHGWTQSAQDAAYYKRIR